MQTHYCWILFHQANFTLDEAANLLKERGFQVEHHNIKLSVSWHDGPTLHISFTSGSDVQQQSQEIADDNSLDELLNQCDQRFEIAFDDLDEVLNEMNTLIEVQLTLQNATRGLSWNSWNGQLMAPEKQ